MLRCSWLCRGAEPKLLGDRGCRSIRKLERIEVVSCRSLTFAELELDDAVSTNWKSKECRSARQTSALVKRSDGSVEIVFAESCLTSALTGLILTVVKANRIETLRETPPQLAKPLEAGSKTSVGRRSHFV